MPSLYLGNIGGDKGIHEIHALTKDLPFREYEASEISDSSLFRKLLEGRYGLLERGTPIYCTAVNPDKTNRIEMNPHDSREGTVHIVAIDQGGEIECALSVAVDLGGKDRGAPIGLPLENLWKPGDYPEGASLDPFRAKYLRSVYRKDSHLGPWELAELYRHYKTSFLSGDLLPRLGVYIGCYHLAVREAKKKGIPATWVWVFDAIPSYFNLYRFAGMATLRNMTIETKPQLISPNKSDMGIRNEGEHRPIFYRGNRISRNIKVPIPVHKRGTLHFTLKDIPFLDGVVDVHRLEEAIRKGPNLLSLDGCAGFNWRNRIKLRMALGILAKRSFEQDYHPSNTFSNLINKWALEKANVKKWEFNHVGSLTNTR